MFEKYSKSFELSAYDCWATVRNLAIFFLSVLVPNIGVVEKLLLEKGINQGVVVIILYAILELGRRFLTNYQK